jgi:hypothetical protein
VGDVEGALHMVGDGAGLVWCGMGWYGVGTKSHSQRAHQAGMLRPALRAGGVGGRGHTGTQGDEQ